MNLTLNRRGDYALRAALYLAEDWGRDGFAKIRDIAAGMSLPVSYTPQILGLLARSQLARAKAGRDGGYRLARPPTQISVLEVIEAAEGDLRSSTCILRGGPCHWDAVCAVHAAWADASTAFRGSLAGTTLADLVRIDREIAESVHPPG